MLWFWFLLFISNNTYLPIPLSCLSPFTYTLYYLSISSSIVYLNNTYTARPKWTTFTFTYNTTILFPYYLKHLPLNLYPIIYHIPISYRLLLIYLLPNYPYWSVNYNSPILYYSKPIFNNLSSPIILNPFIPYDKINPSSFIILHFLLTNIFIFNLNYSFSIIFSYSS